jgi:hypothetical protein
LLGPAAATPKIVLGREADWPGPSFLKESGKFVRFSKVMSSQPEPIAGREELLPTRQRAGLSATKVRTHHPFTRSGEE